MSDHAGSLNECDREPIHRPGSIQSHGLLFVIDPETGTITHAAGPVDRHFDVKSWIGAPIASLIGEAMTDRAVAIDTGSVVYVGTLNDRSAARMEGTAFYTGSRLILELEPTCPQPIAGASLLGALETAGAAFERATSLVDLCTRAAGEFQRLCGFDRVMVYQFLPTGAGRVMAEIRRPDLHSFLHHHFPAGDIPQQARALYLRNLVRIIPDIDYTPAPLLPFSDDIAAMDLSDSNLRSVSPLHIAYLHNMGVRASASVSIVKDGALWGLIACHHYSPRTMSYDIRSACRALAGDLARQIKAKEEGESYRQRLRLRGYEDEVVSLLCREGRLEDTLFSHLPEVCRMMNATGMAVLRGTDIIATGVCPPMPDIRALAGWVMQEYPETVFATDHLAELRPESDAIRDVCSGVLAMTPSVDEPWTLLWFRAEHVTTINWAGNPHKHTSSEPGQVLTPRTSFEAWAETVYGRARAWTIPELESAARLRNALMDRQQRMRVLKLNQQLTDILRDQDALLKQKEYLIGEVNHRVQNSLQLVSSFLALQARTSDDPHLQSSLAEARRRLSAVALVHRRLYRGDQIGTLDVARYIEELCHDTIQAMGPEWAEHISIELCPLLLNTDRAVTMGLILTELLINAQKYAYTGGPGPVEIQLSEKDNEFRLVVADKGAGVSSSRKGFGSRMIEGLVGQLNGKIERGDNKPGLRVTINAPILQDETS